MVHAAPEPPPAALQGTAAQPISATPEVAAVPAAPRSARQRPARRQQPAQPKAAPAIMRRSTAAAPFEPSSLTRSPKTLRYWRRRVDMTCLAVRDANFRARRKQLAALEVPNQAFDLCRDVCSDERACAGALDWIRLAAGPGVALEAEQAALYRVPGKRQRDDWSTARSKRKLALLTWLLMSPHELARCDVTGSTSTEPMLVTAGVPQTLLVKLLRSGQRAPYNVRTLQRDLAEIDECTDLLLRWRTPIAKAETWECRGETQGVVNRYCMRAGMIREQWRRASCAGEALAKRLALRFAGWMVWRPRPRGELVPLPAPAT